MTCKENSNIHALSGIRTRDVRFCVLTNKGRGKM